MTDLMGSNGKTVHSVNLKCSGYVITAESIIFVVKMAMMTIPGILLFGISGGEILMLILLVLLLFGPKKIPEIARMLGKGLGEVRKVQREINSEIHRYSSEMEGDVRKMESEVKKEVEAFKHTPGETKSRQSKSADESGETNRKQPADSGETAGQTLQDSQKHTEGQSHAGHSDKPGRQTGDKADEEFISDNDQDDDLPYPYRKNKGDESFKPDD